MNLKVKNIISVSDKENLVSLKTFKNIILKLLVLVEHSSIMKLGYQCTELSKYTGLGMLDGRVKTLHPKIHMVFFM